ncbi:hypothetical protein CEK26_009514 [Fusarium fujikuroi]|nr:hypothetical protein CEK27_009536 [Fusarium fujikuroi]QGI82812.1 hypothetical protein CEK25_009541 [Fusarium fujikuroi]QGI96445.1 hypothetical protein CEK26_009514 [Fusarium fujikuroi]
MAISLVSRRSGFQLGKLRFYLTIISPWCFAPRHHQQLLINNSTSYTPIPDTLDWENQTRFKLFPRIELKQKKKKRKLFVFSCPQCNFASREPGNPDRLPARVIIPARRDWEAEIERKRRMRTFLYYVEGEIWPKTNLRKERSRGTGMQMTSFPNRDQEPKGPDAHGNSFGGSVSGLGDPN